MSREKKGANARPATAAPSAAVANEAQTRTPISSAKKIIFAIAALVLVPAILLGALELGLRAAGFGYPTSFFLEIEEDGVTHLINNDKFGWRFFPKELARSPGTLKFAKEKAPGTFRIFVFGESAALGDPKPAYSMGRYLEVLLRERFPGAQFEVITVAMTAINSHAIIEIARECAKLSGDFWVVYMGNNEMAGPFGVNPISGPAAPSRTLVRLSLALRATKIGQLVESIAARMRESDDEVSEWEGTKMFREHRVAPDDPTKKIIYANFRENLRDILRAGQNAGAHTILCTVASNQRDFAPFASLGTTNEHYLRGLALQNSDLVAEANEAFLAALKLETNSAEIHFRLGLMALELGENSNATTHFRHARDLDTLPLRPDSMLLAQIGDVYYDLASSGALVRVLDLETEIAANLPARVPGDETFFDHVHFTFAGNYRAARLIAAQIESGLPKEVEEKRAINRASAPHCERALGLTDWNRRAAVEQMYLRQSELPFTDQSNHSNRLAGLARTILELRESMTARAATNARAVYIAALENRTNDFRLRENFAEFLEITGDLPAALEQRLGVAKFVPHDPAACYHAGRLLGLAGRGPEARAWLARALQIRPSFPEALFEQGKTFANEAKHDQALALYTEALKLRPDDARMLIQRAHSLAALNRRKEAMDVLREAIRVEPEDWEPRYLLGIELATTDEIAEAARQFAEVTRLRPGYAQAHFNLAVALAKMGKLQDAFQEFQITLQLDPNHKLAQEYLGALAQQSQK